MKWTDEQKKEKLVCEIQKSNKNLNSIKNSIGVKTLCRALNLLRKSRV